jgi:hypothetical protein
MNSVRDDHGFGIVRWPKKLLNNSHQQVGADYQTLGPSKSTIHLHLTALGKIYKSCRIVLHLLTAEQAHRGVEFCRKLLQLPKDHRFIKRIVTCDEKLIYLNNPDLQKQWLNKGQLPVLVRALLQQDNARPHAAKKLFRKSKNWKVLNCYRIPLLVLILCHQTTICFVL